MVNTDQREWVPTSLCDNPMRSSTKYSVPDLGSLIAICDFFVVL